MLSEKKLLAKLLPFLTVKQATITGSYIGGTWKVKRTGNTAYLIISNFASLPTGAFTIGTVPDGFRPSEEANFTIVQRGAARASVALIIQTNGTLRGYNYGTAITSTTPWSNTLAYPI